MRGWWLVAVAAALVAVAYAADRILILAQQHAGQYGFGAGTRELLLAADRIPKLVVITALLWLTVSLVQTPARRGLSWVLIGIGAAVGVVPGLSLAVTRGPVPDLVADVLLPAQFVSWTGAGLVVAGALGLLGASAGTNRPGWHAAAVAVALVAVSWPVDAWLNDAFLNASARGDAVPTFLVGELVARLSVTAAAAGAGWLIARSRWALLPAALTLAVGLIAFAGLAFYALFFVADPDGVPITGFMGRWTSGAVVVLGSWWILRAARAPRDERELTPSTAG